MRRISVANFLALHFSEYLFSRREIDKEDWDSGAVLKADHLESVRKALDTFPEANVMVEIGPNHIAFITEGHDGVEVRVHKSNTQDVIVISRCTTREAFAARHLKKLMKAAKIAKADVLLKPLTIPIILPLLIIIESYGSAREKLSPLIHFPTERRGGNSRRLSGSNHIK